MRFTILLLSLLIGQALLAQSHAVYRGDVVSGTIQVIQGDDFRGNRTSVSCYVRTEDGKTVQYNGPCSENMAGAKVGVSKGQQVVTIASEAHPAPVGTRSLAVILINFTDDPSRPFTVDQVQNMVFDLSNPDSVASEYQRESNGRLNLVGKTYDWVTVDQAINPQTGQPFTGCDKAAQVTDAATIAVGADGFDHYMYVVANISGCDYAGFAYLFESRSWIVAYPSPQLMFHELGHNFGLQHAAYMPCLGSPYVGLCTPLEYGDTYDPMGSGLGSLHAANKAHCGWIDASDVVEIGPLTANRPITVLPTEGNAGVRDVVIPFNDATPYSYHVEFRVSTALSSPLIGVLIRMESNAVDPQRTFLIPGGQADPAMMYLPALTQAGQVYRDQERGITITVSSIDSASASITVGGSLFDPNAPAITSIAYSGGKKLVIHGARLGSSARVFINRIDVSNLIKKAGDSTITMKGKSSSYHLASGQNAVRIVSGNLMSNAFSLEI